MRVLTDLSYYAKMVLRSFSLRESLAAECSPLTPCLSRLRNPHIYLKYVCTRWRFVTLAFYYMCAACLRRSSLDACFMIG